MSFQNKVRPTLIMLTCLAYLSPQSPESRQNLKIHICYYLPRIELRAGENFGSPLPRELHGACGPRD